jgi:hypothetical protein
MPKVRSHTHADWTVYLPEGKFQAGDLVRVAGTRGSAYTLVIGPNCAPALLLDKQTTPFCGGDLVTVEKA